jgi:hypothetical protein
MRRNSSWQAGVSAVHPYAIPFALSQECVDVCADSLVELTANKLVDGLGQLGHGGIPGNLCSCPFPKVGIQGHAVINERPLTLLLFHLRQGSISAMFPSGRDETL